jgi:hypothetical protein
MLIFTRMQFLVTLEDDRVFGSVGGIKARDLREDHRASRA